MAAEYATATLHRKRHIVVRPAANGAIADALTLCGRRKLWTIGPYDGPSERGLCWPCLRAWHREQVGG